MIQAKTVVVLGSYAPSLILFRGPLIAALASLGHRVIAMAPDIGSDVADRLRELGAEPRQIGLVNASLGPLSTLKTLAALRRAFREIRPDAVLSYTIKPVTLGSIAAASVGVPKIIALITGLGFAFIPGPGAKRRIGRAVATILYRRALRKAHVVIFQNPDDRQFFADNGLLGRKGATVVNGSGIDLAQFTPAPLPAEPRFLMISRLLGDKGVREYAAAAAALKARHPQVRFALVGYFDPSPDGISREEFESWNGAIDFLGKLDDVRPAIAAASVYVLPSYREGTPRSSLEAMAMGRPIVTTDAVGCRETVVDGVNGFLVDVRSAESLARGMEKFIHDPSLIAPMGAQSRQLAERKFDVHRVNDAIIAAAGL
jgi:glycosyltransferase involved in cell wall biosynthesis